MYKLGDIPADGGGFNDFFFGIRVSGSEKKSAAYFPNNTVCCLSSL
jgi:hypothetical protein